MDEWWRENYVRKICFTVDLTEMSIKHAQSFMFFVTGITGKWFQVRQQKDDDAARHLATPRHPERPG